MTDHIEFTPTPADMAAAARDLRPRNWGRWDRLRLTLAGVLIALAVFFAFARYAWQQHGVYLLYWEDLASFSFAGAVLGWLYGKLRTRFAENDPRLAERSFVLGKDGFETRGRGFETKVDWTGVAEIADRRDNMFFITEWKEHFFVPKRAFASREEAEAFRQRAGELWSGRWDEFTRASETRVRPERYNLVYRLDRSDLAAFAALKREITGWRKALIFAPAIVLGGAFGLFRDSDPAISAFFDRLGLWLIAIVIAVVGLCYLLVILAMSVLRAYRVRRAVLPAGDTRLAADRQAVVVSADGVTERRGWAEVPAVTLGAAHVFLFTAPRTAFIVPLRAFAGRGAMREFFTFADEASKNADI